ncbi:MAG: hypothetical protein WCG48_00205 [Candidatus Berkelbacteria bacterium]
MAKSPRPVPVSYLMFESEQRPMNLNQVLQEQIHCMIANGVHHQVGIYEEKFFADAMNLVEQFEYSVELDSVDLCEVWFVHYDLRDEWLCEINNVDYSMYYRNKYVDMQRPTGLQIIQGQLGTKYKGLLTLGNRDTDEYLGIPKEGLMAFLFWKNILRSSNMIFPGSKGLTGILPKLFEYDDKTELGPSSHRFDPKDYGFVTVHYRS